MTFSIKKFCLVSGLELSKEHFFVLAVVNNNKQEIWGPQQALCVVLCQELETELSLLGGGEWSKKFELYTVRLTGIPLQIPCPEPQ